LLHPQILSLEAVPFKGGRSIPWQDYPGDRNRFHSWGQVKHSKYLPLDERVPVLLTIHDLNFLHDENNDRPAEWIKRQLADVQARVVLPEEQKRRRLNRGGPENDTKV